MGSDASIGSSLESSAEGKGVPMPCRCVTGMTDFEGLGGRPARLEEGFIVGRGDLKSGNPGDQRCDVLLRSR